MTQEEPSSPRDDIVIVSLTKEDEERYGSPPCDYCWLAFGSQARQELALGSDQDNALLLPNGVSLDDRNYFRDFSAFVNDGLDQ